MLHDDSYSGNIRNDHHLRHGIGDGCYWLARTVLDGCPDESGAAAQRGCFFRRPRCWPDEASHEVAIDLSIGQGMVVQRAV